MSAFDSSTVLQAFDGQLYQANWGAALPTDSSTPLDAAFISCGWLHEDGLTFMPGLSADDPIKGWPRGEILLQPSAVLEPTFKFTLMQHLDADSLDWIVDPSRLRSMVLEYRNSVGGLTARLILPKIKIKESGDIPFNVADAISTEVTVGCVRDDAASGVGFTFRFILPTKVPGTDLIKEY